MSTQTRRPAAAQLPRARAEWVPVCVLPETPVSTLYPRSPASVPQPPSPSMRGCSMSPSHLCAGQGERGKGSRHSLQLPTPKTRDFSERGAFQFALEVGTRDNRVYVHWHSVGQSSSHLIGKARKPLRPLSHDPHLEARGPVHLLGQPCPLPGRSIPQPRHLCLAVHLASSKWELPPCPPLPPPHFLLSCLTARRRCRAE